MYLRYRAKYYNNETEKTEFGFFLAADYLKYHCIINSEDKNKLEYLIKWFNNNLPIPYYYNKEKNRQSSKAATSWFKETSGEFITQMNVLSNILEKNNIEVQRISSKKILGKIIYEDDYQVTIIPFRDVTKNIK